MDATSVIVNLAGLVPLAVTAWFLVLPCSGSVYRRLIWWPVAAIAFVALGGYLGAAVGAAFDESLRLAAFSWIERPLFAAKVIATCALVGRGFSFGVACLVARVLHRFGWTYLPRQLVGAHS